MGLCYSKLFNKNHNNHQTLIHPAQPIYFNNYKSVYPQQFHRPPPYNPESYQFNAER